MSTHVLLCGLSYSVCILKQTVRTSACTSKKVRTADKCVGTNPASSRKSLFRFPSHQHRRGEKLPEARGHIWSLKRSRSHIMMCLAFRKYLCTCSRPWSPHPQNATHPPKTLPTPTREKECTGTASHQAKSNTALIEAECLRSPPQTHMGGVPTRNFARIVTITDGIEAQPSPRRYPPLTWAKHTPTLHAENSHHQRRPTAVGSNYTRQIYVNAQIHRKA